MWIQVAGPAQAVLIRLLKPFLPQPFPWHQLSLLQTHLDEHWVVPGGSTTLTVTMALRTSKSTGSPSFQNNFPRHSSFLHLSEQFFFVMSTQIGSGCVGKN